MDQDIRIAFITPEAPPFSGGGIATFINNITRSMKQAGIFCEVFAPAIGTKSERTEIQGIACHRIATESLATFRKDVVPYFLTRHQQKGFTVIESCEIHASILNLVQQKLPGVKYVIRVQMPVVYQQWLNHYYQSAAKKLRYVAGALRRGKFDLGFWNKVDVKRFTDPEYLVCEQADAVIAPSTSFKNWLATFWRLPSTKITVIHHLFDFETLPDPLAPRQNASEELRVLFVGKLNAHKGVINLAKAARIVWKRHPNVTFTLVGEDWPVHYKGKKYDTSALLKLLTEDDKRLELTGKINYADLSSYYSRADICIFPSLWEAWGYTCSEAMSYGKAVIGSRYGGMADAIDHGVNGLLVDPHSVEDIGEKLDLLIEDRQLRDRLGREAKETIRTKLAFDKLMRENLAFYENLLQN